MAARWAAAGNEARLAVYPGGAHVFMAFPCELGRQSLERIDAFLSGAIRG